MSDPAQAARDDLAFMRALAEDKDPLPWGFGAHLLAPALLYSPTAFLAWIDMQGLYDVADEVLLWAWAPAMLVHIPIWFALVRGKSLASVGPAKRAFAGAWQAMALMTLVMLVSLFIASTRLEAPLMMFWPSIALTFYGGAWFATATAQPSPLFTLIGLGSLATALVCAFLINTPAQWLVLGLGILAWLGAPGLLIMIRARLARA